MGAQNLPEVKMAMSAQMGQCVSPEPSRGGVSRTEKAERRSWAPLCPAPMALGHIWGLGLPQNIPPEQQDP